MCTITYLPLEHGYIVTQNRDESPKRELAKFPIFRNSPNEKLIYPKDPQGSGTWFLSKEDGETICVMNAIHHFNKSSSDFKHSRGLVPLHYLNYKSPTDFIEKYNFNGIQGFTLIICKTDKVFKIHWNEKKPKLSVYDPSPLIFQSDPLYSPKLKKKRISWFNDFINQNGPQNILDFHKSQDAENPSESILMDRQIVKTTSIIQRKFDQKMNFVQYAEVDKSIIFSKRIF